MAMVEADPAMGKPLQLSLNARKEHARMHARTHTYTHTYIHTYLHACMHYITLRSTTLHYHTLH